MIAAAPGLPLVSDQDCWACPLLETAVLPESRTSLLLLARLHLLTVQVLQQQPSRVSFASLQKCVSQSLYPNAEHDTAVNVVSNCSCKKSLQCAVQQMNVQHRGNIKYT